MIEEFEEKNRAELNEVMEVPFDFKMKIEDWIKQKRDAVQKLRMDKKEVMAVITSCRRVYSGSKTRSNCQCCTRRSGTRKSDTV